MSQSGKLLKNTLIYTAGNLGAKLLSFLMVPLYTFYLTKADLGTYDLLLTSASLLVPFISIQMSEAAYRWLLDIKADNGTQKQAAVTNSLAVFLVNNLVFIALFAVAQLYIKIPSAIPFVIILFTNGLMGFLQMVARGLGLNKVYSFVGFSYTFFLLLANGLFVMLLHWQLPGILYSIIVSGVIAIAILAYRCRLHKLLSFSLIDKKAIKAMMAYAWPLMPNAISWWLINEVNRFIILFYLGIDANGIFAISNRFPSIILIVNSIFMLAWQDHAIQLNDSEEKDAFYSKIFNVFVSLELSLVICLTAVSRYVVKLVVSPLFFHSWVYMPILYLGVAFASFAAFLGVGYLSSKQTRGLFTTTIFGSVVNVLISVLTIRSIGLYAPAAGTCVGFLVIWLLRLRQTRGFIKLAINYTQLFTLLLTAVIVMVLVALDNPYADAGCVVIAAAAFFTANKPLLVYLYGFAQKFILSFTPKAQ